MRGVVRRVVSRVGEGGEVWGGIIRGILRG